jgi:hypothetical protein
MTAVASRSRTRPKMKVTDDETESRPISAQAPVRPSPQKIKPSADDELPLKRPNLRVRSDSEPTAQRFALHAVDAPELIEAALTEAAVMEDRGIADEDD